MIKISYISEAQSLGRASSLFIEKKPLMRIAIFIINSLAILLMLVLTLKIFLVAPSIHDFIIVLFCVLWLFYRKRFNNWLFTRRVANSAIINNKITVSASSNGIVWSGDKLLDGKLNWESIKYCLEAQNGFILPYSISKFLWLPFSGFEKGADIDKFREILIEKQVKIKNCFNFKC